MNGIHEITGSALRREETCGTDSCGVADDRGACAPEPADGLQHGCAAVRRQLHRAHAALNAGPRGLQPTRGGVSLANPPAVASDGRDESRAALRSVLVAFRRQILLTETEADSPSSWQALAARMLEADLDLATLARLREADVGREVMVALRGVTPTRAKAIARSLSDALAHAAGHRFFNDVQTMIRTTLADLCDRLRAGDHAALRDGLRVLGRERALALAEGIGTARARGELLAILERRVTELCRAPDPARLLDTYPGVVAAYGAGLGVTVERRTVSALEAAAGRLESLFAPLVPMLWARRGLRRGDIQIGGDSILAEGLRNRCDFDRLLDLTYRLVSEAAVGALSTDVGAQGTWDILIDQAESEAIDRVVDLLGWAATND